MVVESIHPIDEPGYCRIYRFPFSEHLHYLARLGARVWVSPVGTVAERLHLWRQTAIHVQKRSDDTLELVKHGPENSTITWSVAVALEDPGEWSAVDEMGTTLPTLRGKNALTIEWPGDVDVVVLKGDQSQAGGQSQEEAEGNAEGESKDVPGTSSRFELACTGHPYQPMTLIVIDATVNGEPLEAGDEIAVMDGANVVGDAILENNNLFSPSPHRRPTRMQRTDLSPAIPSQFGSGIPAPDGRSLR